MNTGTRFERFNFAWGAAFDFHAGTKKMAPAWMQRRGLEWLFRACSEPRRLGKRYLTTNSIFAYRFAKQWLRHKARPATINVAREDAINQPPAT